MTNFFRLKHSDPDFHRLFDRSNIDHFKVYTSERSLIGEVHDTWVDEAGRYYLVINRSPEYNADKVLVPLDRFQIDSHAHQINTELSAAQLSGLPIVTADGIVRNAGSTVANQTIGTPTTANSAASSTSVSGAANLRTYAPLEASAPLETSAPLDVPHPDKEVQRVVVPETTVSRPAPVQPSVQPPIAQPIQQSTIAPAPAGEVLATPPVPARTPARIAQEEKIQLLEERLVVNARKRKVGDVIMRKEVVTEMVQVPVRREKLIVEQLSPERRQLVEVDLSQGDRSTIELIESLNASSNLTGSQSVRSAAQSPNGNGQGSLMSIQAASQLLAELASRSEYQGANVRIEFTDPGLQAEYQLRSRQSSTNPY
jgi:stress response protein YsnF